MHVLKTIKLNDRCSGTYRIFDGRRRSDITLHDLGKEQLVADRNWSFAGPVWVCGVTAKPLGGNKRKNPSEEEKFNEKDPYRVRAYVGNISSSLIGPVKLVIESFFGNIVAFIMPISFAVLIIIVRKYPNVDMIPAQFIAGVIAAFIGFLVAGKLSISPHDLFLGFLAGVFQIGFGFILITIGSQKTPAAVVGVLMLTEAVLGPIWAWLFINEIPPISVIIGGGIIIFAILLEFSINNKFKFYKKKIEYENCCYRFWNFWFKCCIFFIKKTPS